MAQHTAPDKHDFLCHFNHHFFLSARYHFMTRRVVGEEGDIFMGETFTVLIAAAKSSIVRRSSGYFQDISMRC